MKYSITQSQNELFVRATTVCYEGDDWDIKRPVDTFLFSLDFSFHDHGAFKSLKISPVSSVETLKKISELIEKVEELTSLRKDRLCYAFKAMGAEEC